MPERKHKVSAVYPKVRDAIAILLAQDKYDLPAAAAGAGLPLHRLKDYLSRPSVRSYLRDQRRVQIETLCASNANALARIRDEGENAMAVVNAVRQAETMRARIIEEDGPAGAAKRTAGLVIVIGTPGERSVRVEPQLAGARSVESIAYERGPDRDDDALADDDEVLGEPVPAPARVRRGTRGD
jgi:hypothetical protein